MTYGNTDEMWFASIKGLDPAGRPKLGKEKKRRVNLMLEPATYEYLRRVGEGSASTGVALIVLHHVSSAMLDTVKKLPKRRNAK